MAGLCGRFDAFWLAYLEQPNCTRQSRNGASRTDSSRARPGLFRGSQAALRRRSAGIKRASPAFLPGRCSEGVPGSVAVNLRDRVEICRRAAWGRRSKRPGRKVGHKKGPGRGRNPGPQVWIRFGDVTESRVGPLREESEPLPCAGHSVRPADVSKSFGELKIFFYLCGRQSSLYRIAAWFIIWFGGRASEFSGPKRNPHTITETSMNVRNSKILLKSLVAGYALALAAGCATTAQLEEVRAEAAEAKRAAEQAQSQLANARSMIEEAMAAARAAQSAADASQNCCTDLERKLDRALQDMQRK